MTILQWNYRGFRANFEKLKTLVAQKHATVLCLQEIKVKDSDSCSLNGFNTFKKCALGIDGRAVGGAAILIKKDTPHQHIPLTTNLQAVAVRVTLHRLLTVCSIYLPPGRSHGDLVELDRLVQQLPPPLLLLGDFNAHGEFWGSEEPRPSDWVVEDFIAGNDLSILNTGSQTYLHPASGSFTVIDLSLCSPSAHIDFTWEVDTDQHGSDHFPIFISNHKVIFTDGSKSDSAVAFSATADNLRIQIRLSDSASIFSAELLDIYQVLTLLECLANDQQQFLIATNSLSSLQALGNFNIKHPYVFKILEKCTLLHKKGIDLVISWCPSHVGVMGNERADLLAKEALSFTTYFGIWKSEKQK
ncbi:hypothetical protein CAPTEDRAFT_206267 [Capitella teleta]|uniref:RNase H type-1 domain-containing protein n=1 Tax=Capitella teleta TaxID=283909 RepID=R7UF77_CAPTE|nr:hypothetical protein CAPTEDRAFT_206267 [Capitella teleta]|eukprot:ELU02423.1 hypothetical protein CAPTEDRAFT_206267 [Capitella teleta]